MVLTWFRLTLMHGLLADGRRLSFSCLSKSLHQMSMSLVGNVSPSNESRGGSASDAQ